MSRSGKKKNFTLQERSLLLEILKEFKHIIENKKTDNVSAAIKKQTWTEIAERYNTSAIISEPASGEQLRRLWTNLKTRQRDALTRERQYRLATGGGGPCPDAEIDQNISEIVPTLLLEIQNAIDSDSTDIPASTNLPPINIESASPPIILQSNASPSIIVQPPPSTIQDAENHIMQPNQPQSSTSFEYSSNEKKLRVQILKQEHINRERRADEIHVISLKHKKEIHELEKNILKEKLKEAKARAESVHKDQ